MDDVTFSLMNGAQDIEAPRSIVNYYNRDNIKGFDDVGYFVYRGVKVYEAAKMEETKKKEKENYDLHKKLFELP